MLYGGDYTLAAREVSKRSSSSFVIFEGQFSMLAPSVNKMLLLRLHSQTISDESVSYSCYNMLLFMPNTPCRMHFRSKHTYVQRTNERTNEETNQVCGMRSVCQLGVQVH